MTQWRLKGRDASLMAVSEALALARSYRRKMRQSDKEARDLDATARAVGSAIRRAERERMRFTIGCRPGAVSGRKRGGVRLRNFESALGLVAPMRSFVASSGFSSFHLKFTPRGLGTHRRAKDRAYTRDEAVRAVRYILREAAREIADGGIVSNISKDPDGVAGMFAALEELELAGGRINANVYTSVVISLPHELEGRREALLAAICAPLSERDLPFVAVLHTPDPEGDRRNYHAHILFSWRPFKVVEDGYTFADETLGALNEPAFVTDFRTRAARVMNEAMEAAGKSRRFTAEKRDRTNSKVTAHDDKLTAGQKHHRRRQSSIEAGRAEQGWIAERDAVLARAEAAAASWLTHDPVARAREVAALCARDATLVAARSLELAPPIVETTLPAPDHSVAQRRTTVAVSHEKRAPLEQDRILVNRAPARAPADSGLSTPTPVTPGATPDRVEERTPVSGTSKRSNARQRENAMRAAVYRLQAEAREQLESEAPLTLERVASLGSVPRLSAVGRLADGRKIDARTPPNGVELGQGIGERPDLKSAVDRSATAVTAVNVRSDAPVVDTADPPRSGHLGREARPSAGIGKNDERQQRRSSNEPVSIDDGRTAKSAAEVISARETIAAKLARQREARAGKILATLSQLEFLPLLPVAQEDGGRVRSPIYELVVEEAAAGDEAIIKAAAEFQQQESYQALFRDRFDRMLKRLRRDLTADKAAKPVGGKPLRELFSDHPRLQAAMAANGQNEYQRSIEKFVNDHWSEQKLNQSPTEPIMPSATKHDQSSSFQQTQTIRERKDNRRDSSIKPSDPKAAPPSIKEDVVSIENQLQFKKNDKLKGRD